MKNLILIFSVLFISACATMPTMKSVVGTYEGKVKEDFGRLVLLENGVAELYANGKKFEGKTKWQITKGKELHVIADPMILIFSINKDNSITIIGKIEKGDPRSDHPKEDQWLLKKIK